MPCAMRKAAFGSPTGYPPDLITRRRPLARRPGRQHRSMTAIGSTLVASSTTSIKPGLCLLAYFLQPMRKDAPTHASPHNLGLIQPHTLSAPTHASLHSLGLIRPHTL